MNNLKWMGHLATILDIHKNLHSDLESCEVTLIAKGYSVKAHRFVLSSCSDLLRHLLRDIPLGEKCTILVPDIKGSLLDTVMTFIYLGETYLSSNNLSEFLEAINVLGIKSPISFECATNVNIMQNNTTSLNVASAISSHSNGNIGTRSINNNSIATTTMDEGGGPLPLERPDMINHHNSLKLGASRLIAIESEPQPSNNGRGLEFLDVYHEALPHNHYQHHKITYSIEQIPDASQPNEYILADSSGAFTITRNPQIESMPGQMEVCEEGDDNDDLGGEGDVNVSGLEAHIIEEYSSNEDPLLHLAENDSEKVSQNNNTIHVSQTNVSANASGIIQMTKQAKCRGRSKGKITKFKIQGGAIIQPKLEPSHFNHRINTKAAGAVMMPETGTDEQINLLNDQVSNDNYLSAKDHTILTYENINESNSNEYIGSNVTEMHVEKKNLSAADMAYHAMINENLSLPRAALKFNVSKTELWRRVRNTGVENYLAYEHQTKTHSPDDAINLACHAVIVEGYSLQKAAIKYDISKTVLWRRVRKHPDYMKTAKQNPLVAKAYERLKSGESLKSISRDLDIPMSTLHRYKVRLSQKGQLPDFVTCRRRDSDSKDNLKLKLAKAVHACVHEGMSQNHAANLYEISKSTLWRHLQKRAAEAEVADINEQQSMHAVDDDENDIKQEIILS